MMRFSQIQFRRGLQRLYLCGSILWIIALAVWFPWRELRKAPALTDADIAANDYSAPARQGGGDWFQRNAPAARTGQSLSTYGTISPPPAGYTLDSPPALDPDTFMAEQARKQGKYSQADVQEASPPLRIISSQPPPGGDSQTPPQRVALIQLLCLIGAPVIGYGVLFHVARWVYRGFVNA
jgi:hypothetical protein